MSSLPRHLPGALPFTFGTLTCTDCQRYQEKYTFPAEYQLRTCHGVSTAVHVRKACIWMRRTNPNTIDAFNAGRCFDQRRPIQERRESPCENGTAGDFLWRFQISQSICTSKTLALGVHGAIPGVRVFPPKLNQCFHGRCKLHFSHDVNWVIDLSVRRRCAEL